ncbi:glycoside hydrolase family 75 protein [Streptomyces sp. NPDC006367]|uniref:glycoside hydrolase family 75 protein n=1 Tax=unclassified Streptomyces TaxID=2593676 RepID=UPI0033A0A139
MRVQSLTLVAAGAALLAPTTFPAPPAPPRTAAQQPPARPVPEAGPRTPERSAPGTALRRRPAREAGSRSGTRPRPPAGPGTRAADGADRGPVRAADLLARTRDCAAVSRGRYRSDAGTPADIPVCGTRDAVYWKADLDVDCDGRPGDRCNSRTDPHFTAATAYTRSDGRPLDAEKLPYVVVPQPSGIWNPREDGVRGGSVVAVVHGDRVGYAVVGDVGPSGIIGEASYAAAKSLGVPADPSSGGTPSGVTYIVFKDSGTGRIEDTAATERAGERLARKFAAGGRTAR